MAKIFDQIVGHKSIISHLLQGFQSGRMGQTYLFVGPTGVGKKKVAHALSQVLLCEKPLQGCGECPSCKRVELSKHENLKTIEPDGSSIKVEQARELIEYLSLKSLHAHRIVIIDEAHLMNTATSNALLKVLEEPPHGTFYFLIAPSLSGVLPTVRSRSRVINFHPLTEYDLKIWSSSLSVPDWALKAAQGRIEVLKKLLDPSEQEFRRECLGQLENFLDNSDFFIEESWRSFVKERSQALKMINYWIHFLRDAVVLKNSSENMIYNSDLKSMILSWRSWPVLTDKVMLNLIEELLKLEEDFKINRDSVLAIESIRVRSLT